MKNNKIVKGLLALSMLLMWGCSSMPQLPEVGGYKMFTLPSSNYKAGFLVAIWSKPPKEDIIFRPALGGDVLMSSRSVDLSQEVTSATKAEIQAKLERAAQGQLEAGFSEAINFRYTNTRVIDAEHTKLYRDLTQGLDASPKEKDYVRKLTKRRFFGVVPARAQLDVLTGVLIADVEFEIDRSTDIGAELSTTELIDLLGADFQRDVDSNSTIVGRNVVIGYRADPHMVAIIKQEL